MELSIPTNAGDFQCPGFFSSVNTTRTTPPVFLMNVRHARGRVVAAMPQPSMPGRATLASGEKDRTVPEFAKRIGHEAMWKRHHGC